MANWKKSAQYILESNNYVRPADDKDDETTQNLGQKEKGNLTGIDLWRNRLIYDGDNGGGSDDSREQIKNDIRSKGYITSENIIHRLKTPDGEYIGNITSDAYNALKNNKLDSYVTKSVYERNVLDNYLKRLDELQQEYPNEQMSNIAIYKRYNIDPNNFNQQDFINWLDNNNMTVYDISNQGISYKSKIQGGFWGIGGKKLATQQQINDAAVLYELMKNNERKGLAKKDFGALASGLAGYADGITFGVAGKLADLIEEKQYNKYGLNPNNFVKPSQARSKTTSEHPVANTGGNLAGSLISFGKLNQGVSAATGAIKWIANSPQWVQSAINSGITFALAGSAETAAGGGSWQDVLKNAYINLVGGAAGGSLSGIVGDIGEKLISNPNLRHKIIPEIARNILSSAAFVGGKTASTYYLYPEGSRPTAEDVTRDVTAALAFASVSSVLNTMKTSRQNKANLDVLKNAMAADYENMARASVVGKDGNTVVVDTENLAKNVIKYGDAIENYLNGKGFEIEVADYSNGTGMTAYGGKSTGAVPTKTITQAKGARFVGQEKYVKSILAEVQTIKSNAYDILNKASTASASTAPTGTAPTAVPASGLSTAQPAATAAQSVPAASTPTVSTPPPVVSEPVINTPVTAPAAEPSVNINTAATIAAPASNQAGGVNEEIAKYTPETADNEIKKLEENLIRYGTDDVSRKEVIDTAVDIENALANSDKTVKEVFGDVSKITHDAVTEIKNKAGSTNAYWNLFGENLKAVKSGNVSENIDAVTEYSNTYADALLDNDSEKYNAIMTATDGSDISAQLPKTIMENIIPANAKNPFEYRLAAAHIKNILNDVNIRVSAEKDEVFTSNQAAEELTSNQSAGNDSAEDMTATENAVEPQDMTATENTAVPENASAQKSLHLTQVGDFYEAYGDEALDVADKLNLTPTTKIVDGKSVQTVGFPKQALEQYEGVLGNDYAITVKNQNKSINSNTSVAPYAEQKTEDLPQVNPRLYKWSAIVNDSSSANDIVPQGNEKVNVENSDFGANVSNTEYVHPYDENKVSKEYINSVDSDMLPFIEKVSSDESDNKSVYIVGKTTNKLNAEIKKLTDIDTTLFSHYIKANSVRHIIKDHGINGITDHSMADVEDIARMGYVIHNYDNIELLDTKSKEYRDKNQKPTPMIKLSKKVDGTYYVVEAVPDTNAKKLAIVSAYINKSPIQQTENVQALSSNVRNDSADIEASDDIVSQSNNNVNPKSSGLKKDDISFKSKSEATNDSNSLGETSSMNSVSQGDKNVNRKKLYDVFQRMKDHCYNSKAKDYKYYGEKGVKIHSTWLDNFESFYDWAIKNGYNEGLTIDRIDPDGNYEPDNCRWVTMKVQNNNKSSVNNQSTEELKLTKKDDSGTGSQKTESDTPNLTDRCELIATKHTVTGNDIWVVTLKDRITPEEYKDLSGKVKSVGGYYSRFAKTPEGKAIPGFIFKTEPTEKELSVFNEFFGDNKNILNNQPKDDTIKSKTDKDGAINDESQSTVLAGKGRNDDRGLRSGASGTDDKTGIEEADGSHRENGGERLPQSAGNDGSRSDVGNDGKGIHRGNDEINDVSEAVGASAGNGGRGELLGGGDRAVQGIHRESEQLTESDVKAPETIDTEVKTVERKRPSNKENFIITDNIAAELDNNLTEQMCVLTENKCAITEPNSV